MRLEAFQATIYQITAMHSKQLNNIFSLHLNLVLCRNYTNVNLCQLDSTLTHICELTTKPAHGMVCMEYNERIFFELAVNRCKWWTLGNLFGVEPVWSGLTAWFNSPKLLFGLILPSQKEHNCSKNCDFPCQLVTNCDGTNYAWQHSRKH